MENLSKLGLPMQEEKIVSFKHFKINKKEAGVGPFKKTFYLHHGDE